MATAVGNHLSIAGQEEEINLLRDHFKDNIRILSSIGQFSYILKIRADQYDVSLTLQLDESYPKKIPEIIITAPRLTPDQILLVQKLLECYSETLIHQPMILLIYARLLKWFDENNIQTLTVNTNNINSNNINNPPNNNNNTPIPRSPTNLKVSPIISSNSHNRTSYNDEHNHEDTKKSSMKTIDDVISLIESDTSLDKRYFRVGYIDNILGLQERPFNDFDFKTGSPTTSDRHTNLLSIPKHRIQYLKYTNEVIWDKKSRIDLIFGTTGNQQTMYDVIRRHENLTETRTPPDEKVNHIDHNLPTKRYLTLTDGLYKPNYLLSIPITDPSLISHYTAYREHLISTYPSLFPTLPIDPHRLHLTLLTLRLDSSSQVEQCMLALKRIQEEIHYHCSYPERICLEFSGIDTFHSKILFVKCQQNNRLENLRTLIIERFCEQQQKQKMNEIIFAGNYEEFIPHIILFKSKRKFSSVYQNETKEIFFGKQFIDALQLSSIGTSENEQPTYHCIFKLDLS